MPASFAPSATLPRTGSHRLLTCVLAGLMAGGSLGYLGGCDTESGKADKRVDQAISQALPKINGTEADRSQARKILNEAAGQTNADAGLPQRILAKGLLAQSEVRAAEALQPRIDDNQSRINRLAWEINGLGSQIQSRNQLAAALAKYEPVAVQADLKKNIDQAQGSAEQPVWVKTPGGTAPSLAAVTGSITSLQGQITQLQGTIKSLSDQRAKLVAQSDQLSQQSETAKGDKAVALFEKASAAQKQAADVTVQINEANVKLSRAQADLEVQQGQQKILAAVIKGFGAKSDSADANWTATSNQIKAMQENAAKDLLGDGTQGSPAKDDPTGGKTITSKAARLTELAKDNQALRDEAQQHLNNAIQFFKEAVTLAGQQQKELTIRVQAPENRERPDVEAWQKMIDALNPARYQLQESNALLHRAELLTGQAKSAATITQLAATLSPILTTAKLELPTSLADNDGKIAAELKGSREKAAESYKAADELLTSVTEGAAPDAQKQEGHIAKIFTDYGWSLLAASTGDEATAKAQLEAAQRARDAINPASAIPQNLPPALAMTAPAAPTAQ